MSDLTTSKAGTITSGEDRFMEWKTKDGSYENTQAAQFDTFFEGIFEKERFLDILQNFICFNVDGANTFKILAGYHQYFAVKKAVESTKHATVTDGKGGVFWHTQGSGKSLSMVFYAHYLQKALESPTIVVITDRNDLDNQLYGQFSRCKDFLRQTPQQAESRQNLQELLAGRQANGIIFTTMQKFEETGEALSQRRNIVVMADEAHRGQYGLTEKIVTRQNEKGELEVKTSIGTARIIRDSLPGATYIGFTGTPISSKDRSTREVFGDYIDIYDMTQAVEDGATRPVYYESRVIHLKLDENTLRLIDAEYDLLAQNTDPFVIEKSKKELGQMEAILGNEQTIASLVDDILDHYENYRAGLLTGKAMIVAYSRPIAMKIYKRILQLRPDWAEKVAVVMTQGNNDPEEWREVIGNKAHKEDLARKFKDNSSPLKIAIVVDMWLTGFDVPSLATMYVYKPMAGHNLMQAIARVNLSLIHIFLWSCISNSQFELYVDAIKTGTSIPHISGKQIAEYPVPCFNYRGQKKIGAILRSMDNKIELNGKINNALEQQAQAIFVKQFIERKSITNGWKRGNLLDIANYLNGLAMQKYRPHENESGLPVLKIKELRQGSCDADSEQCSPGIKSEYIIHNGDVIFSWSGSLLVDIWCGGTCGLNQHLFKVTSNAYDKWFYYLWTKHHLTRFIAIATDKATTMGHIKREDLAKAEVLIPSKEDYKKLSAVMNPIFELIIANRVESRKLAELRDELLPKLMSGEIDISNAELL